MFLITSFGYRCSRKRSINLIQQISSQRKCGKKFLYFVRDRDLSFKIVQTEFSEYLAGKRLRNAQPKLGNVKDDDRALSGSYFSG